MHIFKASIHQRGAVILTTTLVVCSLAAFAALWMVQTLRDHQATNIRRRDLERAYFAAQGGVAQVLHWSTYPADYDTNSISGLFYRTDVTGFWVFPNITMAILANEKYNLNTAKLGNFASEHGYPVSKVESITLIRPYVSDPVPCFLKVRSIGRSASGVRRQVLAYLVPNPVATTELVLPAGLISLGTAGQNGNGKVHWGEAWGKDNFQILNNSMYDYVISSNAQYDQWAKYRTEKSLVFDSNWKSGEGLDIYDEATRRFPGAAPASGRYAAALEQYIPPGTLKWPDLASKYHLFKDMAMAHGRYFTTDAAGNIYEGTVKDSAHKIDFNSKFGDANRDTSPYDLVFIDTINGQPPAPDGSNLASISNSGTGAGMKGVYYICANYTQTGAGNPASLTCQKPDGTSASIPKVYLDGVLYSAGWMDLAGNPTVYGSVVAEKGFKSGGTPEIYYNHKLKDGLELPLGNVGSVFRIVLQKNEAPT